MIFFRKPVSTFRDHALAPRIWSTPHRTGASGANFGFERTPASQWIL